MTGPFCADEHRRGAVREAPLFGLDFVEVRDRDQRTLEVFFLGKAPGHIQGENVRIRGGRRIRGVRVTGVRVYRQPDPALDDVLIVGVNQSGDASEYE